MCSRASSCFYFIKLSTATKCIGIFYTIISVALLVLYSVPLIALQTLPKDRAVFYSGLVISNLALLVTSFLLLHAAFGEGQPKLMWPWLITAWSTSLLLGLVGIAGIVVVSFQAFWDLHSATNEISVILAYLLHSVMLCFCGWVVNSHRLELQYHDHSVVEASASLMNSVNSRTPFYIA